MGLTPHTARLPGDHSTASVLDAASGRAPARYLLDTPADVSSLLNDLPFLGWRSRASVSIRFSAMDARTRLRWERRLTLWMNACGCQTGALLFLSCLVWRAIIVMREPPRTWGSAIVNVGWVFGAALFGKLGGLLLARLLLVVDLQRLRRLLASRPVTPCEVQQ